MTTHGAQLPRAAAATSVGKPGAASSQHPPHPLKGRELLPPLQVVDNQQSPVDRHPPSRPSSRAPQVSRNSTGSHRTP